MDTEYLDTFIMEIVLSEHIRMNDDTFTTLYAAHGNNKENDTVYLLFT
jgi:hypothetical protein